MIGSARSTAAITIVNAIPTGIGCALGIDLPVHARVALRRSAPGAEPTFSFSRGAGTPVVREALRLAIDRYADGGPWSADVRLRSEIPPARGLKSSSAVATAIARATARAAGKDPAPVELARLAAGAGRTAGVSATGAMDDALASVIPGFCVTDNRAGEVVRLGPFDPDWKVALLIPPRKHAPSPTWRDSFERVAGEGGRAADRALAGDWWAAMTANSELVERTMGYEYAPVRELALEHGALGAGVSGLGPALAAVCPATRVAEVRDSLPRSLGDTRIVGLSTSPPTSRGTA
jgi:shikimate kinase